MKFQNVWNDIFETQEWGKYPSVELVRFVARNFYRSQPRSDVKFLEIGCGPGPNLWYLAREGFQIYGIDGSASAVNRCIHRLDGEIPGWKGRVEVADFTSALPFQDESIDAVIDLEAVYCTSFATAKKVYQEAYRILKPGGTLWVMTFSEGTTGEGTGDEKDGMYSCTTGPLGGKGYSRFLKQTEIQNLLPSFTINSVDIVQRSVGGISSNQHIKEWIIEAKK